MKTAKELLLLYLENIGNPDRLVELFTEDGALELPYHASLGRNWHWEGHEVLHNFFKGIPQTFQDFKFQNIKILIETPDQVFAEYEVDVVATKTGRPYHQTYMGRLVSENGKIKLIREAMDMIAVARSLFPNGLDDIYSDKK
ncbi:nuclear transport factor 2 family protein [Mucilaginibacter sp. RCC_168]|uniref:nuclear transport factor 2 family protein n=1 Tax=Mucilaginibacter sp. RCC_168 TaxID=3239221 RepID=UPI0035269EAD